jgi:hypothetical protein
VKDRPYTNYRLLKAIKEGIPVKISDSRPARTNSTSNSLPSFANDGHKWKTWKPILEKGSLWWELDMENFYDVERVEMTIKSMPDVEIVISTSLNRKDWQQVAQTEYKTGNKPELIFMVPDSTEVRFLRVDFSIQNSKIPIEIGEIEVFSKSN